MKQIKTDNAPQAIGPYSQAIEVDGMLFCSGQIPLDPATGKIVEGDIGVQTARVMENLKAVLEQAGGNLTNIVKTTILLKDLNDFQMVNEIYGSFFSEPYPARATFEVARLPMDSNVEIEAIAKI
jgi:2-iminobutanoate/2-iminopropanoate deaminase